METIQEIIGAVAKVTGIVVVGRMIYEMYYYRYKQYFSIHNIRCWVAYEATVKTIPTINIPAMGYIKVEETDKNETGLVLSVHPNSGYEFDHPQYHLHPDKHGYVHIRKEWRKKIVRELRHVNERENAYLKSLKTHPLEERVR